MKECLFADSDVDILEGEDLGEIEDDIRDECIVDMNVVLELGIAGFEVLSGDLLCTPALGDI